MWPGPSEGSTHRRPTEHHRNRPTGHREGGVIQGTIRHLQTKCPLGTGPPRLRPSPVPGRPAIPRGSDGPRVRALGHGTPSANPVSHGRRLGPRRSSRAAPSRSEMRRGPCDHESGHIPNRPTEGPHSGRYGQWSAKGGRGAPCQWPFDTDDCLCPSVVTRAHNQRPPDTQMRRPDAVQKRMVRSRGTQDPHSTPA